MEIKRGTLMQRMDTVLNADAVEWCPYPAMQQILLCGTYKLQESSSSQSDLQQSDPGSKTVSHIVKEEEESVVADYTVTPRALQVRVGGITVYELDFVSEAKPSLQASYKMEMCGVLDIKWPETRLQDKAVFGVVDAEGYFQMFHLQEESCKMEILAQEKLSETSLGLSLGWSGQTDGIRTMVAASDSAGCVTVFDIGDSVSVKTSWQAHDYETWITAFHKFDHNVVYSGGDDCRLKGWDVRDTSRPTFFSKRHQMGVCSIQSHPYNEHLFATGSYDEELLIWDQRSLKQPVCSTCLGGGVWRIKWDPFHGTKILTATMYNGTHIVDCSDLGQNSLPIIAQYDDHNLAYGADWCRLCPCGKTRASDEVCMSKTSTGASTTEDNTCGDCNSYLISTCSFYDHALHLWEWGSQ